MIRRHAARWLLSSSAVAVLFGCGAGSQVTTAPAAVTPSPVAVAPVAVPVLAVLGARLEAVPTPSSDAVPEPVAAPAEPAEPAPAPASAANEMQPAPPTTAPPTTVVQRSVAPATTAAAPTTFEPAAAPTPLNTAAAADFQSRTNSLRASVGLAPLSRNAQLDSYAAAWARELAASGTLRHSSSPERALAAGWHTAGENVGYGSTVASVHGALVASAGHYANLAGPAYSSIGIAVVAGADGRLWVCEVFAG